MMGATITREMLRKAPSDHNHISALLFTDVISPKECITETEEIDTNAGATAKIVVWMTFLRRAQKGFIQY